MITSTDTPSSTSASAAEWLPISIPSGITRPIPATAQAIPRWNRPASECGHESTSRVTSRPWSDVVQVDLTGQLLHTVGDAR